MKILLITDSFQPDRNSAAVQLSDLAKELTGRCDELTVLLPSAKIKVSSELTECDGYKILRLKALETKEVGMFRRTVNEFLMPFLMVYRLILCSELKFNWEGIIWYSPSIFHGPLVAFLKFKTGAKSYLIVRDIFPEWAVDLGLMSKGIPYWFFRFFAQLQYSVADLGLPVGV